MNFGLLFIDLFIGHGVYTKFERNRTIRGGVIANLVYMTLWPWTLRYVLRSALG